MVGANAFVEILKGMIPVNDLRERMKRARNYYFIKEARQFREHIPANLEISTPESDLVGHILFIRDYNERHVWEADADFAYKYYPSLDTIEIGLQYLRHDQNFMEKLRKVVTASPTEFDSLLFEACIATMYKTHGFNFEFIREMPQRKTPDLRVSKGHFAVSVECKRLKSGGLAFHRQKDYFHGLLESKADELVVKGVVSLVDIALKAQPERINGEAFIEDLKKSLQARSSVDHSQYKIRTQIVQRDAMDQHFLDYKVRVESPQILKLIDPTYDSRKLVWHRINYDHISRQPSADKVFNWFAGGIDSATLIRYQFTDEDHIQVMARHLKRTIVGALEQFPENETAIVHTGNYVIEGDAVEQAREVRNKLRLMEIAPTRAAAFHLHSFRSVVHHRGYEFEETREIISNYSALLELLPEDALAHQSSSVVRVSSVPFWNDPMPDNLGADV